MLPREPDDGPNEWPCDWCGMPTGEYLKIGFSVVCGKCYDDWYDGDY